MTRSPLPPTPEEIELASKHQELAHLAKVLAERELGLMEADSALASLRSRYLRSVAPLLLQLRQLEAELLAVRAAKAPANGLLNDRARQSRREAEELAAAVAHYEKSPSPSDGPRSDEIRDLFRECARTFHPDLAIDDDDRARRHSFMSRANAAYCDNDLGMLIAILHEWRSSPETVDGAGIGADLIRVIRTIAQVARRLTDIEAAIRALEDHPFARLKHEWDEAAVDGHDLLALMARDLDARIARVHGQLRDEADADR